MTANLYHRLIQSIATAPGCGSVPVSAVPTLVTAIEVIAADGVSALERERDEARAERAMLRADLEQLREQYQELRARYEVVVAELESEGAPAAPQAAEEAPATAPGTLAEGSPAKRRGRPAKPAQEPAAPPTCFVLDRQSVRAALVALGRDRGLAVLATLGATKFADVEDARLADLAAAIVAAAA